MRFTVTHLSNGLQIREAIFEFELVDLEETVEFGTIGLYIDGDLEHSGLINFDPKRMRRGVSFQLATHDFPNGQHYIAIVDEAVAEQYGYSVEFANDVHSIQYDDRLETQPNKPFSSYAKLRGVLSKPSNWQALITDTTGKTITKFSGGGERIDVKWDGTDDNGLDLRDGAYAWSYKIGDHDPQFVGFIYKTYKLSRRS